MILAAGLAQRTPLVIAAVAFLVMLAITIALILPADEPPEPGIEGPAPAIDSSVKPRDPQLPAKLPETPETPTGETNQGTGLPTAGDEGTAPPSGAVAAETAKQQDPSVEPAPAAAGEDAATGTQEQTAEPEPETEEKPAAENLPNAADFYRQAFAEMQPGDRKAMARMEKIAEVGWGSGDRVLEDLIAANQPAFELLRQGLACPRCRFTNTDVPSEDEPLPHLDQAASLAYLATTKARMLVAKGKDAEAIQRCVAVVKLADHIRGDRTLSCLQHSHALLATVFPTFVTLLQKGTLDRASLQTTLASLRDANVQATRMGTYLTREVGSIRGHVRGALQDEAYLTNKEWRPPLSRDAKELLLKIPAAQRNQFVRDTLAAFDYRCVRILSAVQSDRHADLKQLAADLSEIRLKAKTPGFGRKPKEMANFLVARLMPRLEPLWQADLSDQLKRRVLLCLGALRVFRSQNAAWPAALQGLVPDLLETVPKDPLDPAGGELRYRAVGVEAAVWSVGDDGKDDAPTAVSKVGVPGKDIVYWLQ